MKIFSTRLLAVAAACLLVVLLALFCSASSSSAAPLEMEEEPVHIPTEAEVKKMKVKDLKQFLADRGVACDSCSEKNDFMKKVIANLQTALLPSKRKLKPKGEFWEFWAAMAKTQCEESAKKASLSDADTATVCDAISGAVDSYFMQHGKRTAGKLKKKPANLLKTSAGEPYQGAGRRLLGKLVSSCIKKGASGPCSSQSKVLAIIEGNKVKGVDFNQYITNVGIENTNPMYEALKDKTLNADL